MSIKRALIARKTPSAVGDVALVVALLFGVVTGVTYLATGDPGTAAALLLIAATVAFWMWNSWTRPVVAVPVETKTFRPFVPLLAEDAWKRPTDTDRVLLAIAAKQRVLPVIVGASGVGKSVLVRSLLPDALKSDSRLLLERAAVANLRADDYAVLEHQLRWLEGSRLVIFRPDEYPNLVSRLAVFQDDADAGAPEVLVLDQFEQWLGFIAELSEVERDNQFAQLKVQLRRAQAADTHAIVLSLRAEWYFQLQPLGDMIPGPHHCCHIEGARPDHSYHRPEAVGSDDELRMGHGIFESFNKVLESPASAAAVVDLLGSSGRISPVEAQVAGAAIERAVSARTFDLAETIRDGVEALVSTFFSEIMRGAEHRIVTSKILCALSTRTQLRVQIERKRLYEFLFEDEQDVTDALEYLEKAHLVVPRGQKLELAHDFIALYFNKASISELSALEHESIVVHAESRSTRTDVFRKRSEKRWRLGVIVPTLVLAAMAVRLVDPGLVGNLAGPTVRQPVYRHLLDLAYVPAFITQGLWLLYVALLYDRFLDHLKEKPRARVFSIFIMLNTGFWALAGTVSAAGWPLTLALAGTPVAVKTLLISRREDVNPASRRQLRFYGATALCLAAIFLILGAGDWFLTVHARRLGIHAETWIVANAVLALVLSAVCVVVGPIQAGRRGAALLKSHMAKPLGGKVRDRSVYVGHIVPGSVDASISVAPEAAA